MENIFSGGERKKLKKRRGFPATGHTTGAADAARVLGEGFGDRLEGFQALFWAPIFGGIERWGDGELGLFCFRGGTGGVVREKG